MLLINRYNKYLILILIPALLSCGGPAHKRTSLEDYDLSLTRAINIDWSKPQVRLVEIDGSQHSGFLIGWTETGFIIKYNKQVDTLAYDSLRDYILLPSGKSHTDQGFRYGLLSGASVAAAGSALLLILNHDNDNNTDNPEPLPLTDDVEGPGDWYFLIYAVPATLVVSSTIGAIIGSTVEKYNRFYYTRSEFSTNPWMFKELGNPQNPVEDLP